MKLVWRTISNFDSVTMQFSIVDVASVFFICKSLNPSKYETNLWSKHVNIVRLAEPIRRWVRWRTQVFKIEGFVCKPFLPSPPPPHSFIFWLSFYFSRGQNGESRSPPCLSAAPARFSHFFLLNDFSPLSRSLEQAINLPEIVSSFMPVHPKQWFGTVSVCLFPDLRNYQL